MSEVKLFIEKVLPVQTGVSKAGNAWSKQEYIGNTLEQTPKKIVFSLFGKKIDELNIQQGNTYEIGFDIESRNYVGKDGVERWSTEVKAYKADLVTMNDYQQPAPAVPQMQQQPPQQYNPTPMDKQAEDFFNNQPSPALTPEANDVLPF